MPACRKIPRKPLDYNRCNTQELRKFLLDRSPKGSYQLSRLKKLKKDTLISRLRKLDSEATFPKFLDLPTELRLEVYWHALVVVGEDHRAGHDKRKDITPALLRVCKRIYTEAEPILYGKNPFTLHLFTYPDTGLPLGTVMCGPHITQAVPPCQKIPPVFSRPPPRLHYQLRGEQLASSHNMPGRSFAAIRSLRSIEDLTVILAFRLPRRPTIVCQGVEVASEAVANLCLSASGASELKKVKFIFEMRPPCTREALKWILWPVAFLRTDIVLDFGDQYPGLQAEMETERQALQMRPFLALEPPGDLAVKAAAKSRRLRKDHAGLAQITLEHTDVLLVDLAHAVCNPSRASVCGPDDFADAWIDLQNYVNTPDPELVVDKASRGVASRGRGH